MVAGRYRIDAQLGQGGFGWVYRAHDQKLERAVALKVLSFRLGGSPRPAEVQRFEKEAPAVVRLDHPHIVPVYDAGSDGPASWMVMKLIEGPSLQRVLSDENALDPARTLDLMTQMAGALSHAHRHGIVHRDVKPGNILVTRQNGVEQAWLTDFGVAKLLTGVDSSRGLVLGTPHYMAPEQATARAVDSRADIFALGCVAAELVTGHPTFHGTTALEVLHAVVHGDPDLNGLRERAGRGYASAVQRCLAKSPEDRWQTMDDFRHELEALAARGPASGNGKDDRPWDLWGRRLWRWQRAADAPWDGAFPLVTEGVRKGFGFARPVLAGLDLQVPRGSVYALMGRNGIGKTTLIRTLLGIYRRDAGSVEVWRQFRLCGRASSREPLPWRARGRAGPRP